MIRTTIRAGLGDNANHLAVARLCLLQGSLECLYVGVATDEAAEPAGTRHVEARTRGAHAGEAVDAHRIDDALDAEVAKIVEGEIAADERRRRCAQVAAVRLREALHALRQADGVALRRVVHPQVVTDSADHDLAGVDAHARREADAVLALYLGGVASDLVT